LLRKVKSSLETCFDLAREGITPIVFAQPWNRNPPFLEVSGWQKRGPGLTPPSFLSNEVRPSILRKLEERGRL
jgi:hypothetical protein